MTNRKFNMHDLVTVTAEGSRNAQNGKIMMTPIGSSKDPIYIVLMENDSKGVEFKESELESQSKDEGEKDGS